MRRETELLWFGTRSRLRRISPSSKTITVGRDVIKPAICVRNLGAAELHVDTLIPRVVHRVSTTCVVCAVYVDNPAVTSQPD